MKGKFLKLKEGVTKFQLLPPPGYKWSPRCDFSLVKIKSNKKKEK